MIGHEAMDNGQHNTVLGLIARPKAQRSNSILMKIFYKGQGTPYGSYHRVMTCHHFDRVTTLKKYWSFWEYALLSTICISVVKR